ncbi:MAG: ATP-binding protein [Lachnospiraceae bacterium]|nr:ATP-binding protein [Lachnospiraceae bacterium]
MAGMQFVSCLRFSMQLFIGESVFAAEWKKREQFVLRLLLAAVGYVCSAALVFRLFSGLPGNFPVYQILYYGCLFGLSLGGMQLCFEVKREELLFAGVCGYATQHIAFAAVSVFLELSGASFSPVWDFLLIRLLPYVAVAAAVDLGIIRRNKGKGEVKQRDLRMVLLALAVLFTVIIVSVLVDSQAFREDSGLLQNVFCKIYGALCCMLAIFVAFYMSRQNRILHEKEMMETMLHNMREQQRLSRESVNIINIKCHDLKYRISKISRIEDAKDQQEYVESVRSALNIYDNIFQTGNDALDLVLTEKSLLCNEHQIKLSSMVDGSVLDFVNTTDVYALFGNLLDNAMECVLKEGDVEKRIISLTVSRRNQGSHIHMENYCGERVQFEDGLPITTKKDKDYHGFGVRSVKYIVEKYEGSLLMRMERDRFLVDILFYPKKK